MELQTIKHIFIIEKKGGNKMSYIKTVWVNNNTPAINEDNLNKIEQGIFDNDARSTNNETKIGTLSELETTEKSNIVGAINEVNELKNRFSYSTEEQVIGKWLNGEPIYRQVVYVASLPNSSIANIPFSTRISALISIKGYATNNTSYLPINGSRPDANQGSIGVQFSGYDTLSVITGQDRRSWHAYIIVEYTKPTS